MNQTSRGKYQKESILQQFVGSCFGKMVILVVIIVVLAIIARYTVPSDKKMMSETVDNIAQCIEVSKGVAGDKADDFVNNLTATFTDVDSISKKLKEQLEDFDRYNRIEVYPHTFYTTTRIHNNYRPQGTRVAIGIFGLVISTVNYNDFVLRTGVIRKEYNQKVFRNIYSSDGYLGTNPDLGNSYDTYEGGGSAH